MEGGPAAHGITVRVVAGGLTVRSVKVDVFGGSMNHVVLDSRSARARSWSGVRRKMPSQLSPQGGAARDAYPSSVLPGSGQDFKRRQRLLGQEDSAGLGLSRMNDGHEMWAGGRNGVMIVLTVAILATCGCTRTLYRRQADREANYLVREKSVGTPWEVPDSYTIQPDPRSRFFDRTDPDFPTLPPAGPDLYRYQLPQLRGRLAWQPERLPPTMPDEEGGGPTDETELPVPPLTPPGDAPPPPPPPATGAGEPASPVTHRQTSAGAVALVVYQEDGDPAPEEEFAADSRDLDPFERFIVSLGRERVRIKGLVVQPVDEKYWEAVPDDCLARMLEFESVRNEYAETFERPPSLEQLDAAPRATLPDLFELALLNSREYQRQKEILYERALDVALQRFAYATKFSQRGPAVDTTFTHSRFGGTTVNSLTVPSTLTGNKLMATGGTLVGQFANDVLLTFNGPTGFAADISSEMLFEITQQVLQRDILLEPLIQSERDLIYAARDYARFRKAFFLDIAEQYYAILIRYRQIEINSLNYFAQARNFQQQSAEVRSGISSAQNVIFLNQFERQVLRIVNSLIGDCIGLENSLDSMKLVIGLPTETPINIDLSELEQLTLRDTLEVSRAQAIRWLDRVEELREEVEAETHADMLTADYSLTERLIKWVWEREKIVDGDIDPREIFNERSLYLLSAARLGLIVAREELESAQKAEPPKQRILILQHQLDVIENELDLISRQLEHLEFVHSEHPAWEPSLRAYEEYQKRHDQLLEDLSTELEGRAELQAIILLIDRATELLAGCDTLAQDLDEVLFGRPIDTVELADTRARTDALIKFAQEVFSGARGGLPPIDISMDEAMLTGLVQRLDLMNQRGALADRWRDIKLAADSLRSNLSISATQTIGTDTNRPFSFSTDNATTRMRLGWDLPLNRKLERNAYRRSLINYNVGLRDLMRYEDTIKLNIRRQMRNLSLARIQYPNSVDVAALAEEQVISTRLQLIFGMQGVRADDLLGAYNDVRIALAEMVAARIGYITERARFAFELEALMLDDVGYWPEINDPDYQPRANRQFPANAGAAYGDFPSYLKVSHELRRMLHYPPPDGGNVFPPEDEERVEAMSAPDLAAPAETGLDER